jgi:glutamate/tyrosine decarboxylase-like PLP-dependent enzyme
LDEPAPAEGRPFPELLDTVREVVQEFSRHNGHPRFFGYVSSPGLPAAAMGSMIAAAFNINVTCWRSGPAATEMELLSIRWLKEMVGYPAGGAGLLVSGGSMANFAGIAAARSAKAPGNVVRDGMGNARMRLYASEEAHFSIRKAAAMLGIGANNVRSVKTGPDLRMDVADLERLVREDRAAGHLPFCVVASAGTAGTGAVDPIGAIAGVARAYDLWRWRPRRAASSNASATPIQWHSIRTSGSTFRWAAAACSIATPPARGRHSARMPNTRAWWAWRMTKRSPSGTTARNSRARFARSICGCC